MDSHSSGSMNSVEQDVIHAFLQEFPRIVRNSTYQSPSPLEEEYISIVNLEKWLSDNQRTFNKVGDSERDTQPIGLVSSSHFHKYTRMCCLSIHMQFYKEPGLIRHFLRFGNDEHLFSHADSLGEHLENGRFDKAKQFALKVRDEHRKYYPVIFKLNTKSVWGVDDPLPIHSLEPHGEGGNAEVYRILVQEEFVHTELRKAVPEAYVKLDKVGGCYQFALKVFDNRRHNRYDEECDAYSAVQGYPGFVKYLGCFRKRYWLRTSSSLNGTSQVKKTCNILLQWADMDLVKYFKDTDPPFLPHEILEFWRQMFELAEAVKAIHNLQTETGSFIGIHADIKPANILVLKEGIKLADLGYARFKRKKNRKEIHFSEPGGTKSYAAPEQFKGCNVDSKIDIWSLGIVFAIAATWVAKGQSGISDFRQVRIHAHRELAKDEESTYREPADAFFHQDRTLPVVEKWHNLIRDSLRRCDEITSKVLDLVDNKMLRGSPKDRINATQLCEDLRKIFDECWKSRPPKPAESILNALKNANDKATEAHYPSSFDAAAAVVAAAAADNLDPKHELMDRPVRRTAARDNIPKPTINQPSDDEASASVRNRVKHQGSHQISPPTQRDSLDLLRRAQASFKTIPRETQSIQSPGFESPTDLPQQNGLQATAEISRRKSIFKLPFRSSNEKDAKLEGYFENRDIVMLIDNSESMLQRWDEMSIIFETVVSKCYKQDKDGMDLYYTFGNDDLEHKQNAQNFMNKINKKAVKEAGVGRGLADMEKSLRKVFDKHLTRLARPATSTDLALYVFTDGIWVSKHKHGVEDCIVDFIKRVEERTTRKRPVAIQFIQFGQDSAARQFLVHLDDDLHENYNIQDSIDTCLSTVWQTNVYKILLGSLSSDFDRILGSGTSSTEQQSRTVEAGGKI